jgi:hypothetical protein
MTTKTPSPDRLNYVSAGATWKKPKHQPKPATCKHCDQGVALTGDDHWIVQSILPARIKIVRCGLRKGEGKAEGRS